MLGFKRYYEKRISFHFCLRTVYSLSEIVLLELLNGQCWPLSLGEGDGQLLDAATLLVGERVKL